MNTCGINAIDISPKKGHKVDAIFDQSKTFTAELPSYKDVSLDLRLFDHVRQEILSFEFPSLRHTFAN